MITPFGTASTGEQVDKITLSAGELTVSLLTWGALVQDVRLSGIDRSLTLGCDELAPYEAEMMYHGTLIGPIVNRISTARVRIDGMMYELERNQDGRIHLHSGAQATHRRLWQLEDHGPAHATLTCNLPDGLCGLPGNRQIRATYQLAADKCFTLEITGTTDAPTLMNFANHSYWNLDGTETYDGHKLQVIADRFLPGTVDCTPTGTVEDVAGTEMDFRKLRAVSVQNPPFDNNFCLADGPGHVRHALTLVGKSGVSMRVLTDQPGLQVYDARGAVRPGRGPYEGLAIEAQGWPDAPTHRHFPSIRVTPDAPYRQTTQFCFDRAREG